MRRANIHDLEVFRVIADQLNKQALISGDGDDWRTLVVTPEGIEEAARYPNGA
jgi:hypothetical protein